MIIKKLTMNNFGVYAGKNSFEFSNTQPIVLIGGMNGRGKTTFLEAILLALYGSNSSAFKESRYKTYGTYLRSYVNKNSWNQSAFVELEFVMNESSGNNYIVRREWDALSKKTQETIAVYENGVYSDFLTQNWAMFVENILPSALSKFFFFDGEKISELAVDETNTQMKESIRAMLGISVLDVLDNDLARTLRKVKKKGKQAGSAAAMVELRQNKANLEDRIADIDAKIFQLSEALDLQRTTLENLHHEYETKGGNVLGQKQELMQQRSDLMAEIEQNQNALIESAASELPLSLVKELITSIKLQAEDEHDDLIMQEAIGMIEQILVEYSTNHVDVAQYNADFVAYVREQTASNSSDSVYQVSDHALFQLNSLLDRVLEQSITHAADLMKRKASLKQKLDEVDSYLTLDINEKTLGDLFNVIKEQEAAIVQLEVELNSLRQERGSVNAALISATAEFNRVVDDYLQNAEMYDDAERLSKYVSMALILSEAYTVELQKKKTGLLGTTITECYKKLANKKNLINSIVMDPKTLDIVYLDDNNQEVSKDSLSAGEKQLMVIAILWALAICSKKKLPVIIDTPLSRLDSMHRTSLVMTYFPNASDQTVILSTDSEIDHYYYDMMKASVGDEFTLSYDEESKSTSILKGYFQE